MFGQFLKQVFRQQANGQMNRAEKEIIDRLAQSDAMKAAATFAHDILNGPGEVYDPKDPRTHHLKADWEAGLVPSIDDSPSPSMFRSIKAAKAAVSAATDSLYNDIQDELKNNNNNKKK